MESSVQDFISCKRIAIVGLSRSGRKFGNSAYLELKKNGYEVFAVHSSAEEISGIKCYPDLTSIKDNIDCVLISVKSSNALPIIQEAVSAGIKNIWIQKGAESTELLKAAENLDANIIHGKCILMYAPPVKSAHAVHRFFIKLFGKL